MVFRLVLFRSFALAGLWTTGAANIELTAFLGLGPHAGLVLGIALAAFALWAARRAGIGWATLVFGSGVGFSVGAGWLLTALIARQAFEPVPIESLTFSGPSADALMYFLTASGDVDFDIGLVPGVFLGAALSALLAREWKLEGFEGARSMRRYLSGAAMMGFGAMLAGGCAIGAGVTGGEIIIGIPRALTGATVDVGRDARIVKDADAHIVEDLRERSASLRFNYTDPSSNSGFLIPSARLQQLGLDPWHDFAACEFTLSHAVSVLNVAHGETDVAGVSGSVWDRVMAWAMLRRRCAAYAIAAPPR